MVLRPVIRVARGAGHNPVIREELEDPEALTQEQVDRAEMVEMVMLAQQRLLLILIPEL